MSRIFCMSVRRGTNQLVEDGVERVTRSPAGCRAQLARRCPRAPVHRRDERARDPICNFASTPARARTRRASAATSMPTPLAMLYASPGAPARRAPRTRATTSSTCEKSRTVVGVSHHERLRSCRAARRARRTSAGITKFGDWPGPVWLNGRTAITRTPAARCASSASTSCAALEAAYTPDRLLRRALPERHAPWRRGARTARRCPRSPPPDRACRPRAARVRARAGARRRSTLTSSVPAGSALAEGTCAMPARWKIASGVAASIAVVRRVGRAQIALPPVHRVARLRIERAGGRRIVQTRAPHIPPGHAAAHDTTIGRRSRPRRSPARARQPRARCRVRSASTIIAMSCSNDTVRRPAHQRSWPSTDPRRAGRPRPDA